MRRLARIAIRRPLNEPGPTIPLGLSAVSKPAADLGPSQLYPAGVELFQQSAAAREVFYLERGLVKLLRLYPDGGEAIAGLRGSGAFLGAASVVLQRPHSVTAVTISRSHVSRFPAAQFRELLRSNGNFAWQLHEAHSLEVHDAFDQITDLERLSAQNRLQRFLVQFLAASGIPLEGRPIRLHLPLKHCEIAQLIAVTPPYLCVLWRELEAKGLLKRSAAAIILEPALFSQADAF